MITKFKLFEGKVKIKKTEKTIIEKMDFKVKDMSLADWGRKEIVGDPIVKIYRLDKIGKLESYLKRMNSPMDTYFLRSHIENKGFYILFSGIPSQHDCLCLISRNIEYKYTIDLVIRLDNNERLPNDYIKDIDLIINNDYLFISDENIANLYYKQKLLIERDIRNLSKLNSMGILLPRLKNKYKEDLNVSDLGLY